MRAAEDVTFGATPLDRAAHLRGDLGAVLDRDGAKTIVLWRGKPLVDGDTLSYLPLDHAILEEAERAPLFLGLDGEVPVFAIDISPWEPEDVDEDAMGQFFDPTTNHHPATSPDQNFVELRGVMARLSPEDANIAATARAVFAWHDNHEFCARCGNRSGISQAGWQRSCPSCNAQHFPRTDAVVIVLATSGNSVLLGRSPNWPDGMYSLLAGFLEPGETIEAASRREVFEESGIKLGEVRYLASQPWPYPSSLMFGTAGEALNTDLTIDPVEIEDAQWFSRETVMAALDGSNPSLQPARRGSIARFLIERWLKDDLS